MRILNIFDKQKRDKHVSTLRKRLRRFLVDPVDSIPVFVFGKQRSGTDMLMKVFHAHQDTEVFDEHANSQAFLDYRIRSFDILDDIVTKSKAPFVCFKPIADSHLIREFSSRFPNARMIWIYRNYLDNASSSLKKFEQATRAIRLVCTGQSGGGWFQEGVSEETTHTLRQVYMPNLSDFDFACLTWWARNRLVIELNMMSLPNLLITRYEDILNEPRKAFGEIFGFIGMPYDEGSFGRVVRIPPGKHRYPDLNPGVQQLCEDLIAVLDDHICNKKQDTKRALSEV